FLCPCRFASLTSLPVLSDLLAPPPHLHSSPTRRSSDLPSPRSTYRRSSSCAANAWPPPAAELAPLPARLSIPACLPPKQPLHHPGCAASLPAAPGLTLRVWSSPPAHPVGPWGCGPGRRRRGFVAAVRGWPAPRRAGSDRRRAVLT